MPSVVSEARYVGFLELKDERWAGARTTCRLFFLSADSLVLVHEMIHVVMMRANFAILKATQRFTPHDFRGCILVDALSASWLMTLCLLSLGAIGS